MKKYNNELWREVETYINMWDILKRIEQFCNSWNIFTNNSIVISWKNQIYKFVKSRAQNLIREKYVKIVVWNNYWIEEEEFQTIVYDYLKLTNQKIKEEQFKKIEFFETKIYEDFKKKHNVWIYIEEKTWKIKINLYQRGSEQIEETLKEMMKYINKENIFFQIVSKRSYFIEIIID